MSRAERRQATALAIGMALNSAMATAALVSALPLISLIIQPDTLATNRYLSLLHQVVGSPPLTRFVSLLGLGILTMMVGSAVVDWSMNFWLNRFGAACQNRLARDLMDQMIHAPYSWFLTRNHVTLARLLYDDVSMWNRAFVQRMVTISENFFSALLSIAAVLALSSWTGAIAIVLVGLLAYTGFQLTRPILQRLAATKRKALDTTILAATQAFAGIKDIKLSSRETFFARIFDSSYATASNTHAMLNVWQLTPPSILNLLGQAALVVVVLLLWSAGYTSGEIAVQVALLYLVPAKIVPAASGLSASIGSLWNVFPYVEGIHALSRGVYEMATRESHERSEPKRDVGDWRAVSMVDVGFQYPNSSDWALRHVSLRIDRGLTYGLVGRSASGKSTLADLVIGLLRPSEGSILVDGRPLAELSISSWQRKIGYVPQTSYLADDSLLGNVAFGMDRDRVDESWVLECLRMANLADLPAQLEGGLDATLGDRGSRLSGGQRQRVGIARALYNRPEILVFDEATSALDSISEAEILATLDNLRGRVTLIVIAHRMTTVMHCDQILLLEEGTLATQGSYPELKASHPLFRHIAADFAEESVPTT